MPAKSTAIDADNLRKVFKEASQEQVFHYYDSLASDQQHELLQQLSDIDPVRIGRIFKQATSPKQNDNVRKMEPLPAECYDDIEECNQLQLKEWQKVGLEAIAQKQVAVVLLAGGQGTRLGSAQPKGCYDVQLVSHKSLFQLQAERIQRLMNMAQGSIHWYVMTSGPTRKDTEAFFKQNKYFGVQEELVHFFEQGVLPALTNDGKIIMESKSKVSVAPDGNGGVYASLRSSGVLADMKTRGVKYIHAYCVDNCLVRVADPLFMGYCIVKKAQCGIKVIRKLYAEEPVGIICRINGHFDAVEYSEISKADSESKNSAGKLKFDAANIANHFYTIEALEVFCSDDFEKQLAFHVAKKKIKHIDYATGDIVSPSTPNGIKLELFIFDILAHLPLKQLSATMSNPLAVLSVPRAQDFSPLKNASGAGADCPETSRKDVFAQSERFLREAGIELKVTSDAAYEVFKLKQVSQSADGKWKEQEVEVRQVALELSPLVSYAGESLEKFKGKTLALSRPTYIGSLTDLEQILV